MKKALSILLILVMLIGLLPVTSLASENKETAENPWKGKSAVFVGDSITAGVGTTKIYYQYLNEVLDFHSVTAMGVSGSCISAASDYGQTNQPLINRYQNIPSADIILIFMGTNDYGHETPLGSVSDIQDGTFYGALNVIISDLVAKHTSSKIVFVTPVHRYGFGTSKILGTPFTFDSVPNGVGATLADYVEALKTVCANNGVSVIDLYTECTLDPTDSSVRTAYMPDGLHPNAAGHEMIAEILESHIRDYSPAERVPGTETEPEVKTELIYGNKFASGFSQENRASSKANLYLKAGTIVTFKNIDTMQWSCAKTSSETSSNNLGYFPDNAWSDKETAVVEADGWVGFTFKYRDETKTFDLTKLLSDYISIVDPHAHTYKAAVTAPTCTEQGYTTYTCECGDRYISDYTDPIALHSYRWEMVNNALVSVSTDGNASNSLRMDSGSVTNGSLNNARYTLQTDVRLYHDVPWTVEWCSTGNWTGMIFGSAAQSPSDGLVYLFRDSGSRMFAFGEYNGNWNNYGMILDCDMTVPHVFRLENRIAADGSNGVYLLVDGQEMGAMEQYYIVGKDQNKTVNWANGKDIVFGNIGTTSHPVNGMGLEYLQIWENGHNHSYKSSVTAPTCTEKGFTTYTCSCGNSYTADFVDATGHSYENGICTVCGGEAPGPYAGKTIACIGDSITAGVGVTKDQTDYVTLLAKSLEMDYIRLGASGSTLCTDGHATCNIGKLTERNLAGADVVTILMGINDFVQAKNGYYALGTIDSTDTSTIYGAAHMWCQKIEQLRQTDSLADTEFYFMTPVITSWNNSVSSVRDWDQAKTNIHGYRLRDLCNAIIEVCALYDIPVIDLNLLSGLYYNSAEDHNIDIFGGDGAHPGAAGHQMMAAAIENALLQNHLRDDHDHSYGSWITTTYPDCVYGMQYRVCTICTATESKKLNGKGHTYENGSCTDCGIVHTSTFQILDTRSNMVEIFTYEVGMTWKEWLNSKYNTGMGSCIAIWVEAGPDILGCNPYMDIFVNGVCADYDDLIQERDTIKLVKYQ